MNDTQTRQSPLPFVVAMLLFLIVGGAITAAVVMDDPGHVSQMKVEIAPDDE